MIALTSDNPLEGWITVKEAAEKTGYSERWLRELCRDNIIQCLKVGATFLINDTSLEKHRYSTGHSKPDSND